MVVKRALLLAVVVGTAMACGGSDDRAAQPSGEPAPGGAPEAAPKPVFEPVPGEQSCDFTPPDARA